MTATELPVCTPPGSRDLLVIGGTRFRRFYGRTTGEWQSDYQY